MTTPHPPTPMADKAIATAQGILMQYTEGAITAPECVWALLARIVEDDDMVDAIKAEDKAVRAAYGEGKCVVCGGTLGDYGCVTIGCEG